MASHEHAQVQELKLPSIAESIAQLEKTEPIPKLQTYNETSSPQHSSLRRTHPTFETASFIAALPSPGSAPRSSTGRDFAGHAMDRLESRSTSYRQSSPASDGLFSRIDSGPSTASTSPCHESSPWTSAASSFTSPSLSGELSNNDGLAISPARFERYFKQLEEIADPLPPKRASNPKDQHKNNEQRRRATHNKLYKVQESLCGPMLVRFQDSNNNCYQAGLPQQLVQAMVTGNHKEHSTKTAIQFAHIVQTLRQGLRITNLEEECIRLCDLLENAGISPTATNQSSHLSSQARKRRRSSLVAGCRRA